MDSVIATGPTGPTGAETAAASKAAAIKGMEEMAAKLRETGSELYMGGEGSGIEVTPESIIVNKTPFRWA